MVKLLNLGINNHFKKNVWNFWKQYTVVENANKIYNPPPQKKKQVTNLTKKKRIKQKPSEFETNELLQLAQNLRRYEPFETC